MRNIRSVCVLSLVLLSACGGGGGGGGGAQTSNRTPTFGAIAFSTPEDTQLTARVTATDPDSDALTFTRTSDPALGTVTSLSATTGEFAYEPAPNANGTDSFSMRVTDSAGNASTATISITIQAVNDAPSATNSAMTTTDDTIATGRIDATDADGTPLTFTAEQLPAHGTLSAITADGWFSYEPNGQFAGEEVFTVRATDSEGAEALATVRITVTPSGLIYTGSESQTVITEANAPHVANALWTQLTQLIGLLDGSANFGTGPLPAQIDMTLNGENSGTARVMGTVGASGVGSTQLQYAGFTRESLRLDGMQVVDFMGSPTTTRRYTFKNTAFTLGSVSGIASGSFIRTTESPALRFTGNLKIAIDNGPIYWFRDIDLKRQSMLLQIKRVGSQSTIGWTGTATFFDPARGYVALGFDEPMNFYTALGVTRIHGPIGRGGPTATGASQAKLWVTTPALEYFAIELDLDARGRPSKALAFRRDEHFDMPAGHDASHSLQAAASFPFDATHAEVGRPFFPEGRLSEQKQGRFLTHQWFIDVAPAGSSAELAQADTPRPTLTPDRTGSYLLRLEVFDGTLRSTDYLVVTSTLVNEGGASLPDASARPARGAVDVVDAGTEVTLDARKSIINNLSNDYVWTVYGPNNSLVVDESPGPVLRLSPTQPGTYHAHFHDPDIPNIVLLSKSILVRPAVRFSQPTRFTPMSTDGHLALDVDSDGLIDLVARSDYDDSITLYRRLPNGRFADGVLIDSASTSAGAFWMEDVTGDGRLDLIRHRSANTFTESTVTVSIQSNQGVFAAPFTLDTGSRTCTIPSRNRSWDVLGTVDIDGDGRNDLIRSVVCVGEGNPWMVANRSPGGTFVAADEITLPPGAWMRTGTSGDIDNDGDRDLVGAADITTLNILRFNAQGGFDHDTVTLSEPHQAGSVSLRDLNGDGRLDIVVTHSPTFILTQNANGTFTERGKISGYLSNSRPQIGDVTNDGRLDVVLQDKLVAQQPDGSFVLRMPYDGPMGTLIDFNNDGRVDVVGSGNNISIQAPQ